LRGRSAIPRGEAATGTIGKGGAARSGWPGAIRRRRLGTGCRGFDQAGLVLLQTCVEIGGIRRRCGEGDDLLFFGDLGQ
jgi:hypothetical protein